MDLKIVGRSVEGGTVYVVEADGGRALYESPTCRVTLRPVAEATVFADKTEAQRALREYREMEEA
jgi:hypothetical protein